MIQSLVGKLRGFSRVSLGVQGLGFVQTEIKITESSTRVLPEPDSNPLSPAPDVAPRPLDIDLNVRRQLLEPGAQSVQTSSNSSSSTSKAGQPTQRARFRLGFFWVRTLGFTSPRVGGLCYGLGSQLGSEGCGSCDSLVLVEYY